MEAIPATAIKRRGLMLVLSSPSGAGKTTLARMLVDGDANIQLSISATTRPRRPNEVDGVHYHFVDPDRFRAMREAHEFLEWAEVFGHLYGTSAETVNSALARGLDVVFDIDWQGARQLQAQSPGDVASVFILPPSRDILHNRLRTRDAHDAVNVERRMAAASAEISHWREYQYVLVNDDLAACTASLRAILSAERLRRERLVGLDAFVGPLIHAA